MRGLTGARPARSEVPEAWQALRNELSGLRRDNGDLRRRIERLEGNLVADRKEQSRASRGKAPR